MASSRSSAGEELEELTVIEYCLSVIQLSIDDLAKFSTSVGVVDKIILMQN